MNVHLFADDESLDPLEVDGPTSRLYIRECVCCGRDTDGLTCDALTWLDPPIAEWERELLEGGGS